MSVQNNIHLGVAYPIGKSRIFHERRGPSRLSKLFRHLPERRAAQRLFRRRSHHRHDTMIAPRQRLQGLNAGGFFADQYHIHFFSKVAVKAAKKRRARKEEGFKLSLSSRSSFLRGPDLFFLSRFEPVE